MLAVGNFLFLTPAKTGSTSLEKYLSEHFKIKLICTKHDIHVPAAYRNENPECKTVLLVRNPYDWFISHYYWSNTKADVLSYAKRFLKSVSSIMPYVSNPMYEGPIDPKARLITKAEARAALHTNPEMTRQYISFRLQMFKPLSLCVQVAKPDYIIKLENIQDDLKELGFDVKNFPHVNQSSNRPKQALKDFYTKDLLYIIGPFLAKEAKALGYPIMEV